MPVRRKFTAVTKRSVSARETKATPTSCHYWAGSRRGAA